MMKFYIISAMLLVSMGVFANATMVASNVETTSTSVVDANDNVRLYVEPFSLKAGEEMDMTVLLESNGDGFSSFQFDVNLPDGVEFKKNSRGRPIVKASEVLSECEYNITSALQSDGSLRVLGYSPYAEAIPATNKEIVNITIVASSDLADGVYELTVSNVELARPDETNCKPGATSAVITVGDGATGIGEVKCEGGNAKTIYDLQGRKIERITSPGVYIINGKKRFIK
jgi:hypothetical protein